eukprot:jgi/Hompol1/235/HPOL_001869-RA
MKDELDVSALSVLLYDDQPTPQYSRLKNNNNNSSSRNDSYFDETETETETDNDNDNDNEEMTTQAGSAPSAQLVQLELVAPTAATVELGNMDLAGGAVLQSPVNGDLLFVREWADAAVAPRAIVLAFHGLGEHIMRYDHVFSAFAAQGLIVKGFGTNLRGHGRTVQLAALNKRRGATKGLVRPFEETFKDMLALLRYPVKGLAHNANVQLDRLPVFVYGHSLGGLIALSFTYSHAADIPSFAGVIASAPAIAPGRPVPGILASAVKTLGPILTSYTESNKLDLNGLCTDPAVLIDYKNDPYNHDRISLRLARDIIVWGELLLTDAVTSAFNYPILQPHSTNDVLTSFKASRTFFDKIASTDKTFKEFPDLKHELHNEPCKRDIIDMFISWINARIP